MCSSSFIDRFQGETPWSHKIQEKSWGWNQFIAFSLVRKTTTIPDPSVSLAADLHTMCRAWDKCPVSDGISTVKNKQCKDGRVEREPMWQYRVHSVKAPAETRFWPIWFRVTILAQLNAYLTTQSYTSPSITFMETTLHGWISRIMSSSLFLIKAKSL